MGSNTEKKPWTTIYKTYRKNKAKKLIETTFASAKMEEQLL